MDRTGQEDGETRTAGVITRPPVLYLAGLLIGTLLDRLLPLPVPDFAPAHWAVGSALMLAGLALAIAGIRNFTRAGTAVRTIKPTTALVTTGIHGRSRNPIYVGLFLLYAGIGIVAHSPWILILLAPLVPIIRYGVVAREEAYLERRFGDTYRAYKARVRRWL